MARPQERRGGNPPATNAMSARRQPVVSIWRYRLALALLPLRRCRPAVAGALLCLLTLMSASLLLWDPPRAPVPAPVRGTPMGLAISASTGRLYLTTMEPNIAWTLGARGADLLGSMELRGKFLGAVAVNPTTEHVYVSVLADRVAVLAGGAATEIATVDVGGIPTGIAINPLTNRIFVTTHADDQSRAGDSVVVIGGARDTVVADLSLIHI